MSKPENEAVAGNVETLVMSLDELAVGQNVAKACNGRSVLVCRTATGVHAVENLCTHQSFVLEGGRIRNNTLMCPHHGARFDLTDGRSMTQLTSRPLKVFAVRVDGNTIEVQVPPVEAVKISPWG